MGVAGDVTRTGSQSSEVLGGLGDVIVDAIVAVLKVLVSPIKGFIRDQADSLTSLITGTPHPDAVFQPPSNGPWKNVYEYYWNDLIPVALFIYGVMLGIVILLESTSHLFTSYHQSKVKRRAVAGLFGVLSWWWIAAFSLQFMNALTTYLLPDLSDVSLFQTLSFGAIGVLGLVVSLFADFVLFVLIGIVYYARGIVLYLFVLMMPLLVVFWIPGVGPFKLLSKFSQRLASFYVPFLFMSLPVALLFRVADLIGTNAIGMGDFGAWLSALVIPFLALISPFVLIWQTSAIFFVAGHASRHISKRNASNRTTRIRNGGSTAKVGGQNFTRGLRGQTPVQSNSTGGGSSTDSRAHRAGSRLRTQGSGLTNRL